MIEFLRIGSALVRTSLMVAMQYRSDFIFESLTGFLRTFGAVAPLFLVGMHTDTIGGWTVDEALLVMAFFLFLGAVQGGLMEPNLGEAVEAIRQGTLDLWLLKPADAQLLVSMRRIDPAYVWDLIAAGAVGAYAMSGIPRPGPFDVLVAIAILASGIASIYGLWLLGMCTSFFWVRVDNLRFLLMSVADAGRWPISVFTGWIRMILTVVVPVAVVTTFPAEALRGTWGWQTLVGSVLVGAFFVGISRAAWKASLGYYTSASS